MGTTGLVVILFTDVVGSTEVVARLGDERAEQLRQTHFALLREGISEHAGTEVKNLGDGLMVAFGAASDAVACAVAMQQAVERHNRRAGEALAIRVGVAVGEATRDDSDYFGTPVIEAARLCARAEGGRILVTEMARALTGSRGGHHFESLGPMELKGLPEPVPVHQVRWEALAEAAPPLPARLAVDRSLAFIGRAATMPPERGILLQIAETSSWPRPVPPPGPSSRGVPRAPEYAWLARRTPPGGPTSSSFFRFRKLVGRWGSAGAKCMSS